MKDISALKPKVTQLAQRFLDKCKESGYPTQIICTYRSPEEQNALYAQGRTGDGKIVTMAKGGQSLHQYGVAFDFLPINKDGTANWNGDYNARGVIGESIGLEWGGNWSGFKDISHMQYLGGYTLKDFQMGIVDEAKFSEEGVIKPINASITQEESKVVQSAILVAKEASKYPQLTTIVTSLLSTLKEFLATKKNS